MAEHTERDWRAGGCRPSNAWRPAFWVALSLGAAACLAVGVTVLSRADQDLPRVDGRGDMRRYVFRSFTITAPKDWKPGRADTKNQRREQRTALALSRDTVPDALVFVVWSAPDEVKDVGRFLTQPGVTSVSRGTGRLAGRAAAVCDFFCPSSVDPSFKSHNRVWIVHGRSFQMRAATSILKPGHPEDQREAERIVESIALR